VRSERIRRTYSRCSWLGRSTYEFGRNVAGGLKTVSAHTGSKRMPASWKRSWSTTGGWSGWSCQRGQPPTAATAPRRCIIDDGGTRRPRSRPDEG
jgi:hypothetical protein